MEAVSGHAELAALEQAESAAQRTDRIEREIADRSDEVARALQVAHCHKREADNLLLQLKEMQGVIKAAEVKHEREKEALRNNISALKNESASLTHQVAMQAEVMQSWEKRYAGAVAEAEEMRGQHDAIKSETGKKEAEHVALMQALSKELETCKGSEARSRKTAEKCELANQKDALLQKLFQEQLDASVIDLKHTKGKLLESNDERDRTASQLKTTSAELSDLRRAVGERHKEYDHRIKHLEQANQDQQGLLKEGGASLRAAQAEVDGLKERLYEHVTEGRRREQMHHKEEAQLKSEVRTLQQKLASLQEDRERERFEGLAQTQRLQDEVDSLQRTAYADKAVLREADSAKAQQLADLQSEHEQLQLQYAQVSGQVKVSNTDATQKITSLHENVARLEKEVHIAQDSYTQLQQLSERKETSLRAELEASQQEVASLHKESVAREQANKSNALLTWHEREGFKEQAAEKAKELEALGAEYADFKLSIGTEIAVLRKREHNALLRHRAEFTAGESRMKQVESELTLIAGNFDGAEEARRKAEGNLKEAQEQHDKVSTALRAEIEGYQATVKKLEEEVLGNYDKKMLAVQNEELKETVQMFRNQISSLQHTVATVRLEADIIESHKTKSLQDSNAECVKYIMDLQDQLDGERNLLAEILSSVDTASLSPQVAKSIAAYHRRNEATEAGKLLTSYRALALPIDGSTGQASQRHGP